jgi:hypothetical protein
MASAYPCLVGDKVQSTIRLLITCDCFRLIKNTCGLQLWDEALVQNQRNRPVWIEWQAQAQLSINTSGLCTFCGLARSGYWSSRLGLEPAQIAGDGRLGWKSE